MIRLLRYLLASGLVVSWLTVSSSAQIVVDATQPIRALKRKPTAGSSGSMGRKLSIIVRIRRTDTGDAGNVEFTLTNSGKDSLTLPASPNPGDLEPADPNLNYRLLRLSLFVTSDKSREHVLHGGADLYGRESFSGTLVSLPPGESMRVLAHVDWPSFSRSSDGTILVAHVMLDDELIKSAKNETTEESQEIGSATSEEYNAKDRNPQ